MSNQRALCTSVLVPLAFFLLAPYSRDLPSEAGLTAVEGTVIIGDSTPEWVALGIGANTAVLLSNGSTAAWDATPAINCTDCTNVASSNSIAEGDSNVTVNDSGTGEVLIDVDDEDLEFKDGGANQIDVTSNTGVDTIDFAQGLQATSFIADASAAPSVIMTDSTTSGQSGLTMSDAAGPDSVMNLQVDIAGALTTFVEIDGVEETVESKYPMLAKLHIHTESGASYTIGTDNDYEAYGGVFMNGDNDAIEFDLPAAVAGMHVTITSGLTDDIITVDPDDADTIIVDGDAAGGAGNPLVSDADEGNTAELIAIDGDYWVVVNMVGTWGVP